MLPLLTNIESGELIRVTAMLAMTLTVLFFHFVVPAGRS